MIVSVNVNFRTDLVEVSMSFRRFVPPKKNLHHFLDYLSDAVYIFFIVSLEGSCHDFKKRGDCFTTQAGSR